MDAKFPKYINKNFIKMLYLMYKQISNKSLPANTWSELITKFKTISQMENKLISTINTIEING